MMARRRTLMASVIGLNVLIVACFTGPFSYWLGTGLLFAAALFAVGFVLIALYLLPSYMACSRDHPFAITIVLVNILLGWTVMVWIAVLIWSRLERDGLRRGAPRLAGGPSLTMSDRRGRSKSIGAPPLNRGARPAKR